MRGLRRKRAFPLYFFSLHLLLLLIFSPSVMSGCAKKSPTSSSYFALVEGNSWLYEGKESEVPVKIELKLQRPDPSFGLSDGILDLAATGSLGDFKLSEEGMFLEVSGDEVKLHGVRKKGSPPVFFQTPYIWLKEPIAVGEEYSTEIRGNPSPKTMLVEKTAKVPTPWGAKEAFILVEKEPENPSFPAEAAFVPYLGFARISVPGWFELKLKDAALK